MAVGVGEGGVMVRVGSGAVPLDWQAVTALAVTTNIATKGKARFGHRKTTLTGQHLHHRN
ncbi:hypothetical protein [Microbispora sp. ATCC PTA-5024]|uniref:hypothetical protein n=1 Tax=Microbispora sp. ATCC PTA-5024 TaxID=316330 RepID=UPI0012EE8D70|nr:hypothetical protein [Microbispora sp. ATCC PTA-5024]